MLSGRLDPAPQRIGKTQHYSFAGWTSEAGLVGGAELPGLARRLDQLGPTFGRQGQGAIATPALDRGVIAGKQHGRHGAVGARQNFGPAVVRAVEQAGGKAVLLVRARIAEHAGLQARDRIEQRERRNLAAGENEVAEAQLEVDVAIDEALVDAFVARTEQHRTPAEVADRRLPEHLPGRREIDERRGHGLVSIGTNGRQRPFERLDQQHHAGPAAVRPIIDAGMRRVAEITQRPEADVDLPGFESASRHAVHEMRLEQLGEQGDDVEAHRRPQ